MLMLQRASGLEGETEECDAMAKLICNADPENSLCPEACRPSKEPEENDDPVVVKSGDLVVTAEAAANRKIVVPGTSDLDSLTFRSSEAVTLNKVTLERYGYSSAADVEEVRLEDEDGNVIAEAKGLSKDKATLSIKKDYRNVDGTLNATIVVLTTGNNAGGTLGFKVTDVDSSAENENLVKYVANTYDMVSYSGANVTADVKGTAKKYNYEEGTSYEVDRFQVKANGAGIVIKGFTLSNNGTLDVEDVLDKVIVKVDGSEVAGLKYSTNKDGQLIVSFDDVNIEMNKRATFIVSASFAGLDEYNKTIAYYLEKSSDLNAVETKTSARVTVDGTALDKTQAQAYTFNGGKIKLSNTKLTTREASQSAEDVVVAEGNITVSEPISKISFKVNANNTGVEAMRMLINGEEFEGKKALDATGTGYDYTFSNVEIAESGKIQFTVDIADDDDLQGTIKFTPNFSKAAFSGARYDEAREDVLTGDVAGTISFVDVKVQPAAGTLRNTLSKDVEFLTDETNIKVVFDGTYTAKKADVYLNSFYMSGVNTLANSGVAITYHLYLDGEEIADTDAYGSGNAYTFSDVEVEAGKSIAVKVEAEVEAYGSTGDVVDVSLVLGGKDTYGKDIAEKSAKIKTIKVRESGSVTVAKGAEDNTVFVSSDYSNKPLAQFTVKPSNGSEGIKMTELTFTIAGTGATSILPEDLDVEIGDSLVESDSNTAGTYVYSDFSEDLGTNGVTVTITLNREFTGDVTLTIASVNGVAKTRRSFAKRFEKVVAYVSKATSDGTSTTYTIALDGDDDIQVTNFALYASGTKVAELSGEVYDGAEIEAMNQATAQRIDTIEYTTEEGTVTIERSRFADFFKVGGKDLRVDKAD